MSEPITTPAAPPAEPAAGEPQAVTFTAAQLAEADRIADERAQRATNSALRAYFAQQGMTEEEAAGALAAYKAQKASEKTPEQLVHEAQQTADSRVNTAKQSLLQISARAAAAQLGVKAERLDYVLKLADLSGVEVGDDMQVDVGKVTAAVQSVLDAVPELGAGTPAPNTPPANPANMPPVAGKDNPWSREGCNLTEQGRIMRTDPKLAERLKAAAGAN